MKINHPNSLEGKLDLLLATVKEMYVWQKDFLTINETCKQLGISRTHLYELRKNGFLEAKTIGQKKVVITKRSINRFVLGEEFKAD